MDEFLPPVVTPPESASPVDDDGAFEPESHTNIIELIVGIGVVATFLLLTPLPYYQDKNWHTAPSLARSLVAWGRTANKQTAITPTPTPNPIRLNQQQADSNTYTVSGTSYRFDYPSDIAPTVSGDVSYFKSGNSSLMYRYVDKIDTIENLMDNYYVFGVPAPVRFGPRETVNIGILTGYKTKTDNGEITYYFLARPSIPGALVFYYFNGDQQAEELLQKILPTVKTQDL